MDEPTRFEEPTSPDQPYWTAYDGRSAGVDGVQDVVATDPPPRRRALPPSRESR